MGVKPVLPAAVVAAAAGTASVAVAAASVLLFMTPQLIQAPKNARPGCWVTNPSQHLRLAKWAASGLLGSGPSSCPYSPKCVELDFSHLLAKRVRSSSLPILQ